MNYPPSLEIDIQGLPSDRATLAEEVAYRALPKLMDVEIERVDVPGGAPGRHDFELTRGGRRIAVEVTACIDAQTARFLDALDTRALHEDVPGLACSWEVRLHEDTKLAGLIDDVAPLLADLDECGVTGLARPGEYDYEPLIRRQEGRITSDVRDAVDALFHIGVDTAWSHSVGGGPQVVVFIRRSGGGCTNRGSHHCSGQRGSSGEGGSALSGRRVRS